MNRLDLLQELVACPGPPGQEDAVRECLIEHLDAMTLPYEVDAKGNLIVHLGGTPGNVVVMAHMDEIAMIVTSLHADGSLAVTSMGGLYPWKLGEGAVQVLADDVAIDAVLSFGSIHTDTGTIQAAREHTINRELSRVLTGLDIETLEERGVRPGTRVVVHPRRRELMRVGDLVSGYFLDDRADLVSWLLALDALRGSGIGASFVATAAEEVGGEGALFYLNKTAPDVCIALELGPNVPDAPVLVDEQPTVWVRDSYSAMKASDLSLVADVAAEIGLLPQFQALSSGGSDSSCAASHGLCARPFTLGLPMENSHGYEMIHPDSMENLARLTVALVKRLVGGF